MWGERGKYEGKNNKKLTAKKFLVKRIYAPTYECSPPQLNLRCRLRRRRRGVRQRAERKTQHESKSHFSLFSSKKNKIKCVLAECQQQSPKYHQRNAKGATRGRWYVNTLYPSHADSDPKSPRTTRFVNQKKKTKSESNRKPFPSYCTARHPDTRNTYTGEKEKRRNTIHKAS